MYSAMINKDKAELERVHDDSFVLHHMTGMKQSKKEYISAIMGGTLNYYSAVHNDMKAAINGDTARLTGKSKVMAAVFGGGKHTWRLQLGVLPNALEGRQSKMMEYANIYDEGFKTFYYLCRLKDKRPS